MSGKIKQVNGRLKAGNIRARVQQKGGRLYLQATLPPKPGSSRETPYQQRIALGIAATGQGLKLAEAEPLQEDGWSDSLAHYLFGSERKDIPGAEHSREISPAVALRDRLHSLGVSALSTTELLTLILGISPELGQRLVQTLSTDGFTPLDHLRGVTVDELTAVPGIGPAKAAVIVAAVELGKRLLLPKPAPRTIIDEPKLVVDILSQDLMWQRQEHLAVVLLDTRHHWLGTHIVSIGTAAEILAHPRDIFYPAIRRGATRIIVAHNHPSGAVKPSSGDVELTKQLLQAATVLGIPLLDHLILGDGQYCSLRQTTELWTDYPQESQLK